MRQYGLLFTLLLLSLASFGQRKNSLSDLRAVRGTPGTYALVSYGATPGDAMGGLFTWSDTLSRADDGMLYVRPSAGLGGWERYESTGAKRGKKVMTYVTGQLTYTFPHGLSYTPAFLNYDFQSSAVPGTSCWSATATTISITFASLPVFMAGTTFTLCWTAYPY